MARKRKQSLTAWEKRNATAKARGYRNYYDYRMHDYGRRPPGQPPDQGTLAKRRRGVRGKAALRRQLKRPAQIALIVEVPEDHDAQTKQWTKMRFIITRTDGGIDEYVVPLDDEYDLDYWHDEFEDAEIDFYVYAKAE